MCQENITQHDISYINSQLTALHANAVHCVSTHGDDVTLNNYNDRQYDFALAYYEVGNAQGAPVRPQDSLFFVASFGAPQVEFVCNHEAVLRLHLIRGHFNLDLKALGSRTTPRSDLHQEIDNFEVFFRVDFQRRTITGGDSNFGTAGKKHINYLAFDFKNATYLPSATTFGDTNRNKPNWELQQSRETSLLNYLEKHYLPLLVRAGHSVLFSLPDFDDRPHTHQIDYSQAVRSENVYLDIIHGVTVTDINRFLADKWLSVALRSFEDTTGDLSPTHPLSSITDETDECRVRARLNPPEVRILCKREVVLIFDVEHLSFFIGDNFHDEHEFRNWKFAVIFDVKYITEDSGNVRSIKLDFTNPRPSLALSFFGELTQELWWLQTYFFDYIVDHYLITLIDYGFDVVHHHDTRITYTGGSTIDDDDSYANWGVDRTRDIEITGTTGEVTVSGGYKITYGMSFAYDHVIVITERSLNARLRYLWQTATSSKNSGSALSVLTRWLFTMDGKDNFGADFGAPQIRLSPTGQYKAVFVVHLQKGFLYTLREFMGTGEESVRHDFTNWYLVFEADIRTRTITEIPADCDLHNIHGSKTDRTIREIYLDLETSKFKFDECKLPGTENDSIHIRYHKALALSRYIRTHYFATLQKQHYNVLFSVPIFTVATAGVFAITDYLFRIHSNPAIGKRATDNSLLILGVCGGRPLISFPSGNFIIRTRDVNSFGTITLARGIFLEALLLERLSRINAVTAIVPKFAKVIDGRWTVELNTWANDEHKKYSTTKWQLKGKEGGALVYDWRVKDEWTYRHEGHVRDVANGIYVVSCETKNLLRVPLTSKSGGTVIKTNGEVELKLSFTGTEISWTSQSIATWNAAITLSAETGGLHVRSSTKTIVPSFDGARTHGDSSHASFTDASLLLEKQLRNCIDLEETVSGVGDEFRGRWPYVLTGYDACGLTNPQFNEDGDLILSLVQYATETVTRPGGNRARKSYSGLPSANGRLAPSRQASRSYYHSIKEFAGYGAAPQSPKSVGNGSLYHPKSPASPTASNGFDGPSYRTEQDAEDGDVDVE